MPFFATALVVTGRLLDLGAGRCIPPTRHARAALRSFMASAHGAHITAGMDQSVHFPPMHL